MRKRSVGSVFLGLASLMVTGCGDDGNSTVDPLPTFCEVNPGEWEDPNTCVADDSCGDLASVEVDLQPVRSFHTASDDNPEIIKMIPGTTDKAVWVSSVAKKFSIVQYDNQNSFSVVGQFVVEATVGAGEAAQTTAIDVHPSGDFIAVAVTKTAVGSCVLGSLALIDIKNDVGAILKELTVGYYPDSVDFSPDGQWLIVANEDDSADPCKVTTGRVGGSISIISIPNSDPAAAVVAQELDVRHSATPPSEPENVRVGSDNNTVLFSIQDSSEVGILKLDAVPSATATLIPLPPGEEEPDGVAISDDVSFAVVVAERTDSFSILDLSNNTWTKTYKIVDSGDVPGNWAKDTRKTTKVHEPQEVELMTLGGALFAFISLQESHAVVAYNLTDRAAPAFNSIAPAGDAWMDWADSTTGSEIGTEGISGNPKTGILFSANEREGTVTMFRTAFANRCPN
jgi:DNA-binding beta-propeller fold protein YncE